jgi:hypothetical protein
MDKKRFLIMVILIVSILLLAGIEFARENHGGQFKQIDSNISKSANKLRKIADEKIEINENAPMKIAVDKYMRKRAEEEARIKVEEEARKRTEEARQRTNLAASFQKDGSSGKNSHATTATQPNVQSEQARAEQILASLIAKNPILQGTTVYVRDCPHNWQGCTYYESAVIWIDPDHAAPLEKIMVHECNHIIDWRSDGDIDNNDYHE